MKNVRMELTVPVSVKQFLEIQSKEKGVSQASIIKNALSDYIKNEQKK